MSCTRFRDTLLANQPCLSNLHRAQISDGWSPAFRIVEALNIIEDVGLGRPRFRIGLSVGTQRYSDRCMPDRSAAMHMLADALGAAPVPLDAIRARFAVYLRDGLAVMLVTSKRSLS